MGQADGNWAKDPGHPYFPPPHLQHHEWPPPQQLW